MNELAVVIGVLSAAALATCANQAKTTAGQQPSAVETPRPAAHHSDTINSEERERTEQLLEELRMSREKMTDPLPRPAEHDESISK